MSRVCRETAAGTAPDAEPILAWKVHLLRENPWRMLVVAPVIAASLVVSYVILSNLFFSAAAFLLLLSAMADFLFPMCFEITEAGASRRTITGRTFVPWDRVKKCYLDSHGVKLSTLRELSRLEAYRGVYLRFAGNREEVIDVIRRMRNA